MYMPPLNKEEDTSTLLAFMQNHSFVTFVSTIQGELIATHIPVMIHKEQDDLIILGHLARANPHCNAFDKEESLIIFTGPHAYISPTHYDKLESVPTWNYAVVHAYGVPQKLSFKDNPKQMQQMILDLIREHEQNYEKQWEDLSEKYKHGMMQGITGFKMKITKLEGKYKLSQNKNKNEQTKITRALLASPDATVSETGLMMQEKLELEKTKR